MKNYAKIVFSSAMYSHARGLDGPAGAIVGDIETQFGYNLSP